MKHFTDWDAPLGILLDYIASLKTQEEMTTFVNDYVLYMSQEESYEDPVEVIRENLGYITSEQDNDDPSRKMIIATGIFDELLPL